MHRARSSLQTLAYFGACFSMQSAQVVSAGASAPASGQSTKAADIPRPLTPSPVRRPGGIGSPALKLCRSAASPPAVGFCAARGFRSVPSPTALTVENVSQSTKAAGLPAAAPGEVISARTLSRPRSLLSRFSSTGSLHTAPPNPSVNRTATGVPASAAYLKR